MSGWASRWECRGARAGECRWQIRRRCRFTCHRCVVTGVKTCSTKAAGVVAGTRKGSSSTKLLTFYSDTCIISLLLPECRSLSAGRTVTFKGALNDTPTLPVELVWNVVAIVVRLAHLFADFVAGVQACCVGWIALALTNGANRFQRRACDRRIPAILSAETTVLTDGNLLVRGAIV